MDDYKIYSNVAKATYDDVYDLTNYNLPNYIIDNQLSNDRTLVVYNPIIKHTIIGYRGTKINQHKDNAYNLLIGLGLQKHHNEYKRNKRTVQYAMNKYKGYKIETVGHSRGALDAYNIGQEFNIPSHSFNPPSRVPTSLITAVGNFLVNKKSSKSHLYYVGSDPVGWLGTDLRGHKHYVKQKVKNPHSVLNFL